MAKKGGAPTKSEILAQVSKDTELSRKQVSEVFESLNGIIKKSLRGNGLFTLPGLLKLKVVKRPATKSREGVNPFTGEKMTFKAKPASKKVRALPLKNLKSFVNSPSIHPHCISHKQARHGLTCRACCFTGCGCTRRNNPVAQRANTVSRSSDRCRLKK